jgi:hypothetical protein
MPDTCPHTTQAAGNLPGPPLPAFRPPLSPPVGSMMLQPGGSVPPLMQQAGRPPPSPRAAGTPTIAGRPPLPPSSPILPQAQAAGNLSPMQQAGRPPMVPLPNSALAVPPLPSPSQQPLQPPPPQPQHLPPQQMVPPPMTLPALTLTAAARPPLQQGALPTGNLSGLLPGPTAVPRQAGQPVMPVLPPGAVLAPSTKLPLQQPTQPQTQNLAGQAPPVLEQGLP